MRAKTLKRTVPRKTGAQTLLTILTADCGREVLSMMRITDGNLDTIAICHEIITTLLGESDRVHAPCIKKV